MRTKAQEAKAIIEKSTDDQMNDGKNVIRRIMLARSLILMRHPFYGMLLMRLQLGLAACGTACTDMVNLLFDPSFANALSDKELEFVMLHEVLHCVLQHCRRGKNYHSELFNIACDIVVNSTILYFLGQKEFEIAGRPVIHLTPDGQEGCLFTAEQVYDMLLRKYSSGVAGGVKGDKIEEVFERIDSHEIWNTISNATSLDTQWEEAVKEAADKATSRGYGIGELPQSIREYILDLEHRAKVDWRDALQDFIQLHSDRYDYSFSPPDKRFSESDFILPAFTEEKTEALDNIWFCVDTSGSISQTVLAEIMSEIRQTLLLFTSVSVKISFFDTTVTEPVLCDDEETFMEIIPSGGGGTSFRAIFRYMKEKMEELPVAVIVLTDGYCRYPDEKMALDVPVLWILYNNNNQNDAPWGRSIHVDS